MELRINFVGFVLMFGAFITCSSGNFVGKNSIGKREEYLDNNRQFLVQWEAYTDTKTIVFELTVATAGYVGFGISPIGGMDKADIIIGGVYKNKRSYFSNRHGVGNLMPVEDDNATWKLLNAFENATHTYLKVGRQLNTCNPQDVAIGNSTSNFIWAIGDDDAILYHGAKRGTSAAIILDPPSPPVDVSNFELWKMTQTMNMPSKTTTYWCTVQKSPPLSTKHHIIGYRPFLTTPEAFKHTHHFIVRKCQAPEGSTNEETFESFLNKPGGECYVPSREIPPMAYCETYFFLWAKGGKMLLFPEHVGYPLAADGKQSYYMLEIHLDNPEGLSGVRFESGLEIFYSPHLRQYDAGTLAVNRETSFSLTIPPKSPEFVLTGHCSPSCSSKIPKTGINAFNVLLHAHTTARKLRLRHFRDGTELPWLSNDDSYDFNFQQSRPLLEEIKILPRDQFTLECTYNTMNVNGAVLGGMSTSEEMCNAYIVYYPAIDLFQCSSEYSRSEIGREFGIESMTGSLFNPTVLGPARMANKTYNEVLDTMIPWTKEFRDRFQHNARYGNQVDLCGSTGKPLLMTNPIGYPKISREYAPVDECASRNVFGTGSKQSANISFFNIIAWILVTGAVKKLIVF